MDPPMFTMKSRNNLIRFWLSLTIPKGWFEASTDETLPEEVGTAYYPQGLNVKALFEKGAVPSKGWRTYKVAKVHVTGDMETCDNYGLISSAPENSTPLHLPL